ncbi:MAG TPA: hypothetical protein VK308_10105 [Pyrinomonadaceae bacterium]|nr:hypothetical protein [Pyrinomonadaceae bacterium]
MRWTKDKPLVAGFYWYLIDKESHPYLSEKFYEPVMFEIALDAGARSRCAVVNVFAGVEISLEGNTLDGFWCRCIFPPLPWERPKLDESLAFPDYLDLLQRCREKKKKETRQAAGSDEEMSPGED